MITPKKKVAARKKNPRERFRIYSPENKKYMDGSFQTLELATDVARTIHKLTGHVLEIKEGAVVVGKVGSISKIGKNPVKRHDSDKQRKVVKAIQLFQRFRVDDPKFIDEITIDFHDVMMKIGVVNAIEYDTVRKGKKEFYRHEFTGKSRPDLASSFDGKQLYILQGSYNFTEDGIVDFNPMTGKEIR